MKGIITVRFLLSGDNPSGKAGISEDAYLILQWEDSERDL